MREPARLICWLTDIDAVEQDLRKREDQLNHHASLYVKASLTSIDRFFMQVRRALTMAERGIVSASADRRLWFGKNAYNPGHLAKLVAVFRVYSTTARSERTNARPPCAWASLEGRWRRRNFLTSCLGSNQDAEPVPLPSRHLVKTCGGLKALSHFSIGPTVGGSKSLHSRSD